MKRRNSIQATSALQKKPPGAAVYSKNKGGGVIIKDLLEKGKDCVLNIWVFNADAKSYQLQPPEKFLMTVDQEKKRKYLESCLQQQRNFSPFVVSADVLICVEAKSMLKQLDNRLDTKCKQPY